MHYQTIAFKIKTGMCTQHSNFEELNHTLKVPAACKIQDSRDIA